MVTNGRRDDPPNYNSIGPGDERNVEPLLSDTRTTPSAPDGPSEAEGGVSPSALVNDLDGYPPPPSYSEVVSDPEKYQTQRENQETQVE